MKPWVPLLFVGVLTGCGGDDLSGPPVLRPGRDQCAECGMSIDDQRFAAALLIERDGRREYLCYDDIGCMLDARFGAGGDLPVREAFVHDHGSLAWVPAGEAAYLAADRDSLRTPMASGIAAFRDRAAAERAGKDMGGEVLSHDELAARRRARDQEGRR
ncbi:MAG: nitrous oxide reductase accessory protein NosL [Phycisphaerales bacterium]|nr:nitrous oxide reductase accessory protein NosL [Phycisphaerales bacterium]